MSKRLNPAVSASERAAAASEDMASLSEKDKRDTNLHQRIAKRKRTTADKIKREHPHLISNE